ncbi:Chymotrypsinogen 2 [Orchesella cincta]|uniref:Chymotrypsinogen 2 n=1 Tax=Orchesella cincta TaxID=48709 RepID=A0A1D2MRB4_ORCCI|nr:Chymotrypsinogen 2 [Orchesella cincta]
MMACKFPLVCGNTILHEEAFCYHRGTHCQHIFENNQRDFLADAEDEDYLEDYVDQNEEHFLQQQSNPLPAIRDSFVFPSSLKPVDTESTRPISGGRGSTSITPPQQRPARHHHHNRRDRNQGVQNKQSEEYFSETVGPFPISQDYGNNEFEENPTCGVARITDANQSGLVLRILGGRETRKGKWPWQVALLNRMQEVFCGGTLIAPRWIITAAHCVRRKLSVTIGEHHLHKNDGTEKHYKVQAAFIHPDFDHETVDNDVALLLLPEPVPTAAGLACLPRENQPLPAPDTLCTILGWGKRNHTHVFGTTALHEGKVPINAGIRMAHMKSPKTCSALDSCAGPILCTEDNRWTVFGVTSFGDGCGRKNKFGIYAKVANYVGWIRKIMRANEVYG